MPAGPLTFAFVMDPLEGIDIDADTTFVLMLEAQQRGHQVLVIDPDDLGVSDGRPVAWARSVRLRREAGNHCAFEPARRVDLDAEAHVVLQRKDPPVDAAYVTATQILGLCRRALVLNRPSGILAANEKLYACRFPKLMTDTLVSRETPALIDFMAKLGGEMIVKPLDGKGGEGIFHVRNDDRNLFSILEQSTGFGRRPVMAQRYLPDVRRGDKRILLVDAEPIGAVLRVPGAGETRSNLHVGGRATRATLDAADERIVAALAPSLRADGLFFVGIDVIGGHLTEVNVTSPTGVQEVNALEGACLEARILDGIEARLDGKSA
ncbi:MAG: glutathione synthase [Deltaproteobacteria bacterium]|nr:glutathione synthase [Deltaproteobacteria bacterium]MBW2360873.1 glutathione synthase [Deltaproteobacteria bacterium]